MNPNLIYVKAWMGMQTTTHILHCLKKQTETAPHTVASKMTLK